MTSRTPFALAFLLILAPAAAAAQPITTEDLRRHIDVLASDAFEGRAPGTAGEKKTTDYLVERWSALGLEPAAKGGTWLQPVPVVARSPLTQTARFRGRRATLEIDQSGLILVGRAEQEALARGRVWFGGLGSAPAKASFKDAVVVLLRGPKAAAPFDERARSFAERGAAAVIGIFPEQVQWRGIQRYFEGGVQALDDPKAPRMSGSMSFAQARRLAEAAGTSLEALAEAAEGPDFRPMRLKLRPELEVRTQVRRIATNNVVGRLRGTGRGTESLLFLGHWDHLGICGDEGRADRICNGAVDNASGIAALTEIAARLAAGPRPVRDILFLATTAEEVGLLGAEHFAADPPVPLASIVAALNLDTIAIAPKGEKVAVIGRGVPALDALIAETVREAGRELDTDGEADAFVQRQDGWALQSAGVPALMVGGSFSDMKKLEAFLSGSYHNAADNPGPHLVLGGAAEDADLMVALGRKLADPARYTRPPAP
jgi:hypothetical protein